MFGALMTKNEDEANQIQDAVIDHVQKIYEQAKVELEKVQCPVHGTALKKLDFDRSCGRFNIETCCDQGENLVNEAITKL
jgi:hypothetical protein